MRLNEAILLSGGMDSVALAYWRRPAIAYTIDYGQIPVDGEIRAAATVCESLSIRHRIIRANCRELGSGDLAGGEPSKVAPVPEWWPFRNQLLLTLAGAAAIADGVNELIFGAVKTDGSHADGRSDFFQKICALMEIQEGGIRVVAPAIQLTSVELIRLSKIPISVLAWSHSCHVSGLACGTCRGCVKHASTMKELGYEDY